MPSSPGDSGCASARRRGSTTLTRGAQSDASLITKIGWAVEPGKRSGLTRPERLVSEMETLDVVASEALRLAHGRGTSGRAAWLPGSALAADLSTAILSPVFLPGLQGTPAWIDLYDDWALAPDIHPFYRLLAARGYARARSGGLDGALITVNTPYMRDRLWPAQAVVVPNGVDEVLGGLERTGSPVPRLVCLGHFFPGRTDFRLLRDMALRPEFEEVVICGPGDSNEIRTTLEDLRTQIGARLRIIDWADGHELAAIAGERSVALVPHRVCDYTVSQDLMKAYQLLALGMKVLCPRLLWPASLDQDFVYLLDHGARLDDTLGEWIDSPSPTDEWRQSFASTNSWRQRAVAIQRLLRGGRP